MRTIVVISGLIMLFILGCKEEGRNILLEYDAVQLIVEEIHSDHISMLKITGHNRNSSLVIDRIETKTEGTSLIIYVYQKQPQKGYSGDFQYSLSVPESINQVQFGKEKVVIWSRK